MVTITAPLDPQLLGPGVAISTRAIDRWAHAHDASHYLLVPSAVVTPSDADDVARIFAAARAAGRPVTFRSGGTSLSGQGVTSGVLVDTRKSFRRIDALDDGLRVRVQPGATVRQTNARLARHHRKLGPDPASEIACTIGGVVANNSSGMSCGIAQNSYRTIESLVGVLPSGGVLDTGAPDADCVLQSFEPELHRGLAALRERLLSSPAAVKRVTQQFSMKNTMGYGLNALLDFETPVDILTHLLIGSEGTLAFVAEATFRTVEVLPCVATGLLVFPSLKEATAAIPALVDIGFATVELMDAQSLRVAQAGHDVPSALAAIQVDGHAALLVEFQAATDSGLTRAQAAAAPLLASLPLTVPPSMTTDATKRAALWHVRKNLYATVAGARPSGTTSLLEDIVVPVENLLATCEELLAIFERHGYPDSVVFGHAKDGNLHFMLNERFDEPGSLERYGAFTEDLVDLVLRQGGSLKAEHGTGRIMAPFVRRQYGEELYEMMREIKRLFDPTGLLNPGVLLTDDQATHLQNLKLVPGVEEEVDRCVECGYCEPTCPSKDLTLTPRQRITLRRDLASAERVGDTALAVELREQYEYDGVQTCAVDGMCAIACPVGINTGDLVRRLRAEHRNPLADVAWRAAARTWSAATLVGGVALSVANRLPVAPVTVVTDLARAALGADTVPRYDPILPGGGSRRSWPGAARSDTADAVFFPACIGAMFGPETGRIGATRAFLRLAERTGIRLAAPARLDSLCCGTPWKSKGLLHGYRSMAARTLDALLAASDGGRLPIVCDAASCSEGLISMARTQERGTALRLVDATEFVHERMLNRLELAQPLDSIAIHPTCSTTALGADPAVRAIAEFVADEVHVPVDWECCAFAGDRGLLHPELTASATRAEAAEVTSREYSAYVSANRTCELALSKATGRSYVHVLEVLEEATRTPATIPST